ncbi:MAG: pyrroline-5-carboxylate reductase [Pseudomonadota bacterium]
MKKQAGIAFVGCGNLSTSLVRGLLASDYPKEKIWVTNRSAEKNQLLHTTLGVHATEDNHEAVKHAEVIVLGVKPQQMQAVVQDIALIVREKKPLVISVAIGISTKMLSSWLGGDCAIVRSMPNTPALVAAGASGLYANHCVTEVQKEFAESVHRAVGMAIWVDKESLIDVVAALSGSGPAYFFYMIEAMQSAAVKLGLPEREASVLALQTALGASKLAIESEEGVIALRRKVTSPKGTTEQAIKVFDERQFPSIIEEGMRATINRAQELAESLA